MAAILNIALFGFACTVIPASGIPMDAVYFLFTIILLLVPVLNLAMLFMGAHRKGMFICGRAFYLSVTLRQFNNKN